MKSHVELLAWIGIISGLLGVLVGLFVMALLVGLAPVTQDGVASYTLVLVGTITGGFIAALSLPGIVAGIGLIKKAAWAWYLALVVAVLALFAFPVGTIIGVYALWVLVNPETRQLLGAGT